jgi:hypothetical protein
MSEILKKLVTKIQSVSEIKQMLAEIFLNNTSKVTKISDNSVLNAFFYAIAKVAQKQTKDAAIIESQIFPSLASGEYLDKAAFITGGLVRLGAAGSSSYVRVKAEEGTQYSPGIHVFSSTRGVQFETTDFVTVGMSGFAYIPVRSLAIGSYTNVPAMTINSVTPTPTGHESCTNEYQAIGGRDNESDESFKLRINSFPNLQAKKTLQYVLEVFRLSNPNILRVVNLGFSGGKVRLALVLENGSQLTRSELDSLLANSQEYLSITDSQVYGGISGVVLENIKWKNVDIDFRANFSNFIPVSQIRQSIQINITKHLDFRYWQTNRKVDWDDLLLITKMSNGVNYVPDEFFLPKQDIPVQSGELPRVRSFIMRDIEGNILFDSGVNLTPVFYQ